MGNSSGKLVLGRCGSRVAGEIDDCSMLSNRVGHAGDNSGMLCGNNGRRVVDLGELQGGSCGFAGDWVYWGCCCVFGATRRGFRKREAGMLLGVGCGRVHLGFLISPLVGIGAAASLPGSC